MPHREHATSLWMTLGSRFCRPSGVVMMTLWRVAVTRSVVRTWLAFRCREGFVGTTRGCDRHVSRFTLGGIRCFMSAFLVWLISFTPVISSSSPLAVLLPGSIRFAQKASTTEVVAAHFLTERSLGPLMSSLLRLCPLGILGGEHVESDTDQSHVGHTSCVDLGAHTPIAMLVTDWSKALLWASTACGHSSSSPLITSRTTAAYPQTVILQGTVIRPEDFKSNSVETPRKVSKTFKVRECR